MLYFRGNWENTEIACGRKCWNFYFLYRIVLDLWQCDIVNYQMCCFIFILISLKYLKYQIIYQIHWYLYHKINTTMVLISDSDFRFILFISIINTIFKIQLHWWIMYSYVWLRRCIQRQEAWKWCTTLTKIRHHLKFILFNFLI